MQSHSSFTHSGPASRPNPVRWLGLGCGGLLTLLLCSCLALGAGAGARVDTGSPTTTTGGKATMATRHWRITADSAVRQPSLSWNNHGGQQPAVGTWLTVAISLTNTGTANHGVNPWDFAVRDSAGNTYRHSNEWVALTHPERLGYAAANNRQIPPGLTISVLLVFDINPAATTLELTFNQDHHPRILLPTP
jgi:hypothetical protein